MFLCEEFNSDAAGDYQCSISGLQLTNIFRSWSISLLFSPLADDDWENILKHFSNGRPDLMLQVHFTETADLLVLALIKNQASSQITSARLDQYSAQVCKTQFFHVTVLQLRLICGHIFISRWASEVSVHLNSFEMCVLSCCVNTDCRRWTRQWIHESIRCTAVERSFDLWFLRTTAWCLHPTWAPLLCVI